MREERKIANPNTSSRNARQGIEIQITTVVDRVESWLVQNAHMMKRDEGTAIDDYESNYLSLSIDQV